MSCNLQTTILSDEETDMINTHLLFDDRVCVKKCKDEAAADDDARAMIEHGLDQDDQQEGDVSAMEVQMIWISRNKGVEDSLLAR